MREHPARLATLMLALILATRSLDAQGITSAAIQGTVARTDGRPIDGAVVKVTAEASGTRWQLVTDEGGRYFLENVQVGGPYVIDAMALGVRPARRSGIVLTLGQRYRQDFVLEPAVVVLDALTVTARADPALNSARTGPAHVVRETQLAGLPNLARDLSIAAALGPLAVLRPLGGISIAAQNQGFNSYQVDGGVNADLYLGRTPGGASPSGSLPEVLPHAISLETVREFQVLVAPFDVRFGSFAGGLLNAVTKSGTNDINGSVFGFVQDGRLVARNAGGSRSAFTTRQFGGTLSGPIVRDRVHFFLNADVQHRVVPDAGPLVTEPLGTADTRRPKVSYASALEVQRILSNTYGLEPGSLGPVDGHLPARDLFGKVNVQFGDGGYVELSHRYAHADRRDFMDVGLRFDTTAFSSVAGWSESTAQTSRLIWNTLVGSRAQNEALVGYQRLWDSCRPNGTLPRIQVATDGGSLIAGPNSVCPTTAVDQSAVEVTENLTLGAGRHLVTVGSHGKLFHFRDPLVQGSAGRWFFSSVDSLRDSLASHYDRGLPSSARPPGADFHVFTLGVYAQDQWAPTARLRLTAGVRVDVPFLLDAVPTNQQLATALRIDTGRLPSGNALWSPRLGVNYDPSGDGATLLRGGIGLFSGPPPYRWLGNAYRESGDERVVICDGAAAMPRFNPINQPVTCRNGTGSNPRISFFDPGLKLPQNLKLAIGVDRRLPWRVVATVDVLYTRAVHQIYVSNANLGAPVAVAAGEGGRPLYGPLDPTGPPRPLWRDAAFGEIYRVSNRSGDYSLSVSTQTRKRFGETMELHASYAYTRARDRMSLVNFPARANFSNTPLDGTQEDRRLRPSFFETPHKVASTATLSLPYRVGLSLLYLGASQPPYTYVITGDANADGIGGGGSLPNDIVYVPRSVGDISLVTPSDYPRLDAFIEQRRCLSQQRGRIMDRGSCRNGWLDVLNARLTKTIAVTGSQHVEITADVFNVPNLVSSRWGRHVDTTTDPAVPLLRLRGWDTQNARGRYELASLNTGVVDDAASRWRVQLGARYGF